MRNTRGRAVAGLLLVALLGATPASAQDVAADGTTSPSARVEPALARHLAGADATDELTVIFSASDGAAVSAALDATGLVPVVRYPKVAAAAVRGTAEQVAALREQPGVRYVQGDRRLALTGSSGPVTTRVTQAEQLFRGPDGSPLDGRGVGIAVVDTGTAGDHPAFAGDPGYFPLPHGGTTRLRNLKQVCAPVACDDAGMGEVEELWFVDETGLDTDAQGGGGHGTHVAAIAGGARTTTANGVAFRGVAPGAALYSLGSGAGLFVLSASASLNWVLEHHADPCVDMPVTPTACPPIKVVNNSYGSPDEYDRHDIFALISERLVLEGVTVVWAAGNGDAFTETNPRANDGSVNLTNPPGQSPLPGVLMVANYDDRGTGARDGHLDPSSSRGERSRPETYPDLSAPGTWTLSACRLHLVVCSSGYPDPDYGEISGTSMAAPHVAGVVALLLQARPDLLPGQVEDVLEDTAHQFGDLTTYEPDVASSDAPIGGQDRNPGGTTSFDKGHGLVDAAAAVGAALRLDVPQPDDGCPPGALQSSDPAGDAGGPGAGPSALDQPTLDLRTVAYVHEVDETAAGTLSVVIRVSDLREDAAPPAPGSVGEVYDADLTVDGRQLFTRVRRPFGQRPSFTLFVQDTPGGLWRSATLDGTVDAQADLMTVRVPVALITGGRTALAAGEAVTPGQTVALRDEGPYVALVADEADGACDYVVPAQPDRHEGPKDPKDPKDPKAPKAPKEQKEPKDAPGDDRAGPPATSVVTEDRRTSWTGTFADHHTGYTCAPEQTDVQCHVYEVELVSDDPYRYLDLTVVPTSGEVAADLDLYMYRDGELFADAATSSGREHLAVNHVPDGRYRIVVVPYQNLPDTSYALTLRYRTAADPPPCC